MGLVAAYLEGDAAAFDVLFGRHQARVRNVCLRFFGDDALADDLLQETFYNVVRSLSRVEEGFNVGGWIHRIALNVCRDEVRRRNRRALHVTSDTNGPDEAILRIPDGDRSGHPEAALELAGLRQLVWDVAKRLPERQRMVLALRELQGLSYASIARVMGITESAVETLLHRARRRFKQEYLLLESPPEERSACTELAFLMTCRRLSATDQRAALLHLEVCDTCCSSYGTAPSVAVAQAAVAV